MKTEKQHIKPEPLRITTDSTPESEDNPVCEAQTNTPPATDTGSVVPNGIDQSKAHHDKVSVKRDWKTIEPEVERHITEYFGSLKKPIRPSATLVKDILQATKQLAEAGTHMELVTQECLNIAKLCLKLKISFDHGQLMPFFTSLNSRLGGILPIRAVNQTVLPLRRILAWATSDQTCPADPKKIAPAKISELRRMPDQLDMLDDDKVKNEIAKYGSFDDFKRSWGEPERKKDRATKVKTSIKQIISVIDEMDDADKADIENKTGGFITAIRNYWDRRVWSYFEIRSAKPDTEEKKAAEATETTMESNKVPLPGEAGKDQS